MPESNKIDDPKMLKKELKKLSHEAKMRKKQLKRERKMRKLQMKKAKKEAVLRKKLAAKGVKIPPKSETKKPEKASEMAESKLPEAEIISDADVWTPKSARKLDEIQKMIDRMDHSGVKSLKERYKIRYGEDLEIPDIYETKVSLEVETAEEIGELESPLISSTSAEISEQSETAKSAKRTGIFGKTKKADKTAKIKIEKISRPLRFIDYRTPCYLRDKMGATGGGGKRAVLLIIDLILNIILSPIKIITTIIYIFKDRRKEKLTSTTDKDSVKPQPTS